MCGIFGTTRSTGDQLDNAILSLLAHRGPDSHGITKIEGAGLSFLHTRLAIQDLSPSGHQPMASRSGRWWLTYNGEIYNNAELRARLSGPFNGTSDTETLIEYIAKYGIDRTLADINGIFGFAAFDRETSSLYVVRDPFGVKPVYFCELNGEFTFSSEVKPILKATGISAALDDAALDMFLSLRYVPSPSTLFQGISRLPPGHVLHKVVGTVSKATVRAYVKGTAGRYQKTEAEAVQDYHDSLSGAVGRQLISDVPVGVLLSAGIDSAVIAALAREHSDDLTAFTVGFGDTYAECEISGAAETARVLGIRHESVEVDALHLIDSLPTIVAAVEEPLGTTSIMPMWYLSQLARKHATVVLAGQGNDEPWGGYRRYQIELLLQKITPFKNGAFRGLGSLARYAGDDGIRRGLSCIGVASDSDRFARAYALFSDDELKKLGRSCANSAKVPISYWLQLLASDQAISPAERMMRIDTCMNLADDLLLYGDKVSMAHALEVRVPMLDPEVVRLIEQFPLAYRANLRTTKIVHRKMAGQYLPQSIINRPKQGFQVPFGDWCKSHWKEFVASHLLGSGLAINQVLDPSGISYVWERHLRGEFDYSRQLFALLTLSLWLERYLGSSSEAGIHVAAGAQT